MKTNIYILLFIVISIVSCGIYEKVDSIKLSRLNSNFIERESFRIRNKPILNREYLIFLCWQIDTYGYSFPRKVIKLLPGVTSLDSTITVTTDFKKEFENYGSFLFKSYILNPKYLDFPVTGLSKHQVVEIEKWMSDRYNENILIELGRLNFNTAQRNNDCFVLESYLIDQYTGSVRDGKKTYWKESILLPTFRMPYKNELNFLWLNSKKKERFRPFSFRKNDFLWKWNKYYLKGEINKGNISFNLKTPFEVEYNNRVEFTESKFKDAYLEKNDTYKKIEYLEDVQFLEKDKYGKQQFIVIGENNFNRPIVANQMKLSNQIEKSDMNSIYWVSYQKLIGFEHWPRNN